MNDDIVQQFLGSMKNLNFYYNIQIRQKIATKICKKCETGKIGNSLTNICDPCYEKCKTCIGKSSGLCTSCILDYRFLPYGNNEKGIFGFCVENDNLENLNLKKSNLAFINNNDIFLKLYEKEKYFKKKDSDLYHLSKNPFKTKLSYILNQLSLKIFFFFILIKLNFILLIKVKTI